MNSKNISPEKIELRKKFPPTYGRRKSRSLSKNQQLLMNDLFPKISVSPENINEFVKEAKGKKIFLEIGFGGGEHLINQAKSNADSIFIGSEIYLNSLVVCLQQIKSENISNIKLYNNDARYLLDKLPSDFLDGVYILFPDPWPKERQFKRRIVNPATLDMLHRSLKPGAFINMATDIESYSSFMIKVMNDDKRYKASKVESEYGKPHTNYIITKYHSKAKEAGREAKFLSYTKL